MQSETLRQKVYDYLSSELLKMDLGPDAFIDQKSICEHLDISRAPLRDALIQLEAEGFVQIFPRRGVQINRLTLEDVANSYGILAAIESYVVETEFHKFRHHQIKRLEELNQHLYELLDTDLFKNSYNEEYYQTNIKFHDVFNGLSVNPLVKKTIDPLKQRLYDFPRMRYDREWELINLGEHDRFIQSVKVGNREAAVAVIRNEHWNFNLHKENILNKYGFTDDT